MNALVKSTRTSWVSERELAGKASFQCYAASRCGTDTSHPARRLPRARKSCKKLSGCSNGQIKQGETSVARDVLSTNYCGRQARHRQELSKRDGVWVYRDLS